jgi:3-phosphoshikimate 1-carboxyvinyltransferase
MKIIPKVASLSGRVTIPPSKSYTARALLLAAMTEGKTTILNALDSDDSRYMIEAIRKMGFDVSGSPSKGVTIGERISMSANDVELFIGNAGTAMRFLTGFLCFTPGRFILSGDQRMLQRPIGDLVDALVAIGAEIEYADREGYPPLRIRGKRMRGGFEVVVDGGTSSQFISSLMLAAVSLASGLDIRTLATASRPYLRITEDVLAEFGVRVEHRGDSEMTIRGGKITRDSYTVEGDYSSASYWIAAGAILGGPVELHGLRRESAQGDRDFLRIIEASGAAVEWNGDVVTISSSGPLLGGTFDCNDTPDIVPTLAAIAPLATEPVRIVNVAHLRVKESDRIATTAAELRKLGATVEESEDSLTIHPGWNNEPATIETHEDHRIAMSFAIAGLQRGNVTIADEQVVSKSYPRFWRTLDELVAVRAES